ncbi:hypothetical protein CFIMG_006405RA [Ceratocystis fimbriata CBS 114723]|uniref:Uncharacterized protein n=1 Tax=Ceratocystis fimbriata CBS 114723 TaxID=1035309 RepID=A0A2C5WYL0_9PEZI|nr:hypothetical protein CFIMG_006405RA [Ceratocystis fimbriata CBS 114723]
MVRRCVGTGENRPGLEGQPRIRHDESRFYGPPENTIWMHRYIFDEDPEERVIPACRDGMLIEFGVEESWDAVELAYYLPWTRHNEPFLRNFHPALSTARFVAMRRNENGEFNWVVEGIPATPMHSYINRIPVLVRPWCYIMPTTMRTHYDLWRKETRYNPRHLLHCDEIHFIRRAFPRSLGVQVLLCGLLVMQYRSYDDILADWKHTVPFHFRGLPITFNVLHIRASTGQQMKHHRNVALGLRLQLECGRHVVTTWTSELIRTGVLRPPKKPKPKSLAQKAHEWWKPRLYEAPSLAVGTTEDEVAKLYKTYDEPFSGPFPAGVKHDLAFIKPHDEFPLPSMVRLPGFPLMTGFSGIQHALQTGRIFLTGSGVDTRYSGRVTSRVVEQTGEAAVQGAQYLWGDKREQRRTMGAGRVPHYTVALLWTVPREGDIYASPDKGRAGTIVCQGSPTSAHAKVVVMKNFEVD